MSPKSRPTAPPERGVRPGGTRDATVIVNVIVTANVNANVRATTRAVLEEES